MSSNDPRLLAIFEAEQREHVERIRELTRPGLRGAALEEVLRRAHTLKGAARAVGLRGVELLAHRLEAVLARVRDGSLELDAAAIEAIQGMLNATEDATAAVRAGDPEPDVGAPLAALEALLDGGAESPRPASRSGAAAPPLEAPPAAAEDFVRVAARYVDQLAASSAQLLAAASAEMNAARGLEAFEARAGRLELPATAGQLEEELRSLARDLRQAVRSRRTMAWNLHRLAADVYHQSTLIRMTPADAVFGMFRKMVRDMAVEEGKRVEFRTSGMDVQADRLVLQALKDPVMHLLRNAVSHGIESPGERAAAAKPEIGSVELLIEARGGRLFITVEDDGRGIDFARVREVAVNRGLLTPGGDPRRETEWLQRLLMSPGFSTSTGVSSLAGRGMGLSVVERQVSRLQGHVEFRHGRDGGAAVVLSVPLSIVLHHVVLVAAGGQTFSLPGAAVERLMRVSPKDVETAGGVEVIRAGSHAVPLFRLTALLGTEEAAPEVERGAALPIVVLRSGEQRAGLVVDALLDECEAAVEELGLPSTAGLASGGVALKDGAVAVMLNPAALLLRARESGARPAVIPPAEEKPPVTILVVDDSITTRALEKSILEAHGYHVRLAVDGVEALERLRAEPVDVVIADVAMPRMDGFELLERIRKDRRLAEIPVIIVTSHEERDDQERGLALGADAYIVKRKFSQRELLDTVRQVL